MQIDGSGRVHLVQSVPVLRPDERVLQKMFDGWRNQQLSRNLQFATIEQRLRCVQRFIAHVNEDPWNWTPATLRSALSPATSATPTTGGTGSARTTSAPIPPRSSSTGTPLPTFRSTTAARPSARTPAKRSAGSSTTPTTRSSGSASRDARAGNPRIATRS